MNREQSSDCGWEDRFVLLALEDNQPLMPAPSSDGTVNNSDPLTSSVIHDWSNGEARSDPENATSSGIARDLKLTASDTHNLLARTQSVVHYPSIPGPRSISEAEIRYHSTPGGDDSRADQSRSGGVSVPLKTNPAAGHSDH